MMMEFLNELGRRSRKDHEDRENLIQSLDAWARKIEANVRFFYHWARHGFQRKYPMLYGKKVTISTSDYVEFRIWGEKWVMTGRNMGSNWCDGEQWIDYLMEKHVDWFKVIKPGEYNPGVILSYESLYGGGKALFERG